MKSKKGEMNTYQIVILIMGIIVLLAMIPEIFNQQANMTEKNGIADEVVNVKFAAYPGGVHQWNSSYNLGPVTQAPSGWKVDRCPLENVVVTNASGTALTLTTDYTFNTATGVLNLKNTTATELGFVVNNNSLIDYTYCPDGYAPDVSSRSIAELIGLFAVLALVVFVIGYGVKEWLNS